MKRLLCVLLCVLTVLTLSVPAWADAIMCRTVIGADLNEKALMELFKL